MPEALRNYLVRLGWSHGDQELFTAEEMIALFDIARVQKAAARFDMEKAIWVNHQYLKVAPPETVAAELAWHLARLDVSIEHGPSLPAVVLAQRERCKTLVEMAEKSRFFFEEIAEYNAKDAARHLDASGIAVLQGLTPELQALETWERTALHAAVHGFAEGRGLALGKVAQPLRVALAGAAVSPPIDETLELLGRERTLRRLARAVTFGNSAVVPGAAS
jgi:glutamyl-tRNA synthetase